MNDENSNQSPDALNNTTHSSKDIMGDISKLNEEEKKQ